MSRDIIEVTEDICTQLKRIADIIEDDRKTLWEQAQTKRDKANTEAGESNVVDSRA